MSINDDIEIIPSQPSIGEQLKQARESKKLTISEVATQLRLTNGTIVNIENERWDALYGAAYARGYFLSYVKYLALPEDELLEAFHSVYPSSDSPMTNLKKVEKKPSNSKTMLIWLIFIVGLIAIAYQQWQQFHSADQVQIKSESDVLTTQHPQVFNHSIVEPMDIIDAITPSPNIDDNSISDNEFDQQEVDDQ